MRLLTCTMIALTLCTPAAVAGGKKDKKPVNICTQTAAMAFEAAGDQAEIDALIGLAKCLNLTDPAEQVECIADVWDTFSEAMDEAEDVFDAQLSLCTLLGPDAYDPEIDPDAFDNPIDNPYLPFLPGTTLLYNGMTSDGLEVVEVTVTHDTREILGIDCVVVRDTVTVGGELAEDTFDYYAQDDDGNVWYFGELSFEYEDGMISSNEGSWIAGEDGAKPGIVMLAHPMTGVTYRQEWLLTEAEDVATVLATNAMVTVPYGSFDDCVQTHDFSALDPDANEQKFYAAGIGFVSELDVDSGETVELISVTP